MADLPCGCRTEPKERLCQYHEGRADERDLIVQWLLSRSNDSAAACIERGAHLDGSACDQRPHTSTGEPS